MSLPRGTPQQNPLPTSGLLSARTLWKQGQALGVSQGSELALFFLVHQREMLPQSRHPGSPIIPSLLPQLPIGAALTQPSPAPWHQLLPLPALPPPPGRPPASPPEFTALLLSPSCPDSVLGPGDRGDSEPALPLGPSRHGQIALSPLTSRLMLSSRERLLEPGKCPFCVQSSSESTETQI